MSDPRAYEQLLASRLRSDPTSRGPDRALELERRIGELTAALAEREREAARQAAELAELRSAERERDEQASSAGRRIAIVSSERDAALREIERHAAVAAKLEGRVGELEERDARTSELERALEVAREELGERDEDLARLKDDLRAVEATRQSEREELRGAIEAAEAERRRTASDYGARIRELEQLVSTLAGGLAQTKADIDRAAGSRAWRWGHGATKALRKLALKRNVTEGALARALKRIEQIEASGRALPAASSERTSVPIEQPSVALDERSEEERGADRRTLAKEIRERLGAAPELASWPPISIVVPTRDGLAHMKRLVDGLVARTDYPDFELVVVDNDSSDGTLELLAGLEVPFAVETIANKEPVSFSKANAQGVERARNDLLLFLNNDIEPFEAGWLRELVAAHEREGVVAAGATLLRSEAGGDPESRDLTVQHRAIKFRMERGGIRAYNAGDGENLFDTGFGTEDRTAAVTAACMMVTRSRFEAVGGFGDDYRFGTEDVDLGLKLCAHGGGLVATGRSVLYHRESATQDSEGRDFKRNNRMVNRRVFLERWGAQVRRDYRLGRLRGDRFWTDGHGPHVAITVTSLDPADGWGDWYTAHEMGDALAALGWRITYVERKGDRWYDLPRDLDYVLSLMDPFDLRRVPAEVTTIAWIRNWTERWLEQPWFDRADVLLVSSGRSEELIREKTGRHTVRFPLATNPARFAPHPPDPVLAADYVFAGNHWGKDRDIQAGFKPKPGERFDLYGRGWDVVPEAEAHARGPASYDDLPTIYSAAKLVLDDTSGPTLPYGAVNSRVFDALASGTLAITNCESGVRELFGEDFPIWTSAESLRAQLDSLLSDDERREQLTKRFRNEVLRHHTYAHRARQLVKALEEHEVLQSFCIKIGAPGWEEAERWGDLHFARGVERQLRGRGHRCLIQVLNEWEDEEGLSYDVALVIRGLSRHLPKPGQLNVLWNISHPAEVTAEECDGYDLVCVASETFAETLAARTKTPVVVLEQATDPTVFYPDPSPEYEHDLVYVANSRNVLRPIVRDLLPTKHDLAIYGGNWDGLIDTKYVVGEYVPNGELRKLYSSAKIVLCDHWDDMREYGFISNRIYDALACGATIISDDVAGLTVRFQTGVHVYDSPSELDLMIERLIADPPDAPDPQTQDTFSTRVEELFEHLPLASSAKAVPHR